MHKKITGYCERCGVHYEKRDLEDSKNGLCKKCSAYLRVLKAMRKSRAKAKLAKANQ